MAGVNGRGGSHIGGWKGQENVEIAYLIDPDKKVLERKVAEVRVVSMHGKQRRQGRYVGHKPNWKKAVVTLAAGETPSPEAVAAAGEVGTLRSSAGIASLVLVALGLVATFFVSSRGQAPGWVDPRPRRDPSARYYP